MEHRDFDIGPEPHKVADIERCSIQTDHQDSEPVGAGHCLI